MGEFGIRQWAKSLGHQGKFSTESPNYDVILTQDEGFPLVPVPGSRGIAVKTRPPELVLCHNE